MSLNIKNKKNLEGFPARLGALLENTTLRDFSAKTGLSPSVLSSYLNKKSYPSLDRLTAIADASDSDINWLVSGDSPNDEMQNVYQYDFRVSAGAGAFVETEKPVAKFSFSHDWLRQQGLFGKELSIVPVMGDSMEPTLQDSDLILVRHDDVRDGVCVLRIDQDVLVKRVQFDYETGAYVIMSDNQRYKAFQIDKEFKGDFEIIGQVVRVLQRVKQYDPVM